jgi:hypothetical protein
VLAFYFVSLCHVVEVPVLQACKTLSATASVATRAAFIALSPVARVSNGLDGFRAGYEPIMEAEEHPHRLSVVAAAAQEAHELLSEQPDLHAEIQREADRRIKLFYAVLHKTKR